MIQNKKQMFIVIAVFTLILLLGTTTYAFFNYTRTGASNTIKVGRISFVTNQKQTINLTNAFPIDPTEEGIMNDSTKVGTLEIEIKGDTDYNQGIEYLVSSIDSNNFITRGDKVIEIPISISVSVTNLGNENSNYWETREGKNTTIYKKIVGDTLVGNQMLLVGYIKPNTTSGTVEGVDGKITIKAYLDKNNILISDTYDGTESDNMGTTNNQAEGKVVITTSEWNSLQQNGLSFKVKVEANEGIWVNGSIEEIMRKSAVMDNINSDFVNNSTPGIDFVHSSSDTNGKGIYMHAGTENNTYPIVYYRGEIDDNNVIFANQCWKTMMTTDTGGVKLIYNGTAGPAYEQKVPLEQSKYNVISNSSENPFTYDASDNSFNITLNNSFSSEIIFGIPTGKNYYLEINGSSGSTCSGSVQWYQKKSNIGYFEYQSYETAYNGHNINQSNYISKYTSEDQLKIAVSSSNASDECVVNIKFRVLGEGEKITDNGCYNVTSDTTITVDNENRIVFNYDGARHYDSSIAYSGYMHGVVYTEKRVNYDSSIYYGNGFTYENGVYKLTSPMQGYDGTHHYSCNSTNSEDTCATIRYYYYNNNPVNYSSNISGYYIELSNGKSIEEAFEEMMSNVGDSYVKNRIDTWYESNISSYRNRLEDTIYCNDRSIESYGGWDPNGGSAHDFLYFTEYKRKYVKMDCAKKDSFTVYKTNGNQMLKYPIAMISIDEARLVGGSGWDSKYFLNNGYEYWTMTPSSDYSDAGGAYGSYPEMGTIFSSGSFLSREIYARYPVRPVISIKPGQFIKSGTGTVLDPYVIE